MSTKETLSTGMAETEQQCCALTPSYPNATRCTEDGFQGWHYCEEHLEVAGDLIATGSVVTEQDYQSPIRRHLDS